MAVVLKRRALWAPVLLSLVACGNGSSSAAGADAGDAPTQLVDVTENVQADSSSESAAADAGPSSDATIATTTAPFFRGGVSASFAKTTFGSQYGYTAFFEEVRDPACSVRQVGACSVLRCDRPADGGPLAIALESAGPIRLSWGDAGASATITPDASYYQNPVMIGPLSTGDVLTFVAAGGDVPAFSARVTFPQQIQLDDASTTIYVAQGYGLAWTGVDQWLVRVDIRESTNDRDMRIVCDFNGDAGAALVSAAALSDLETVTFSASGNHANMDVFAMARTQVDAGGYLVTIIASQGGGLSALPQFQ